MNKSARAEKLIKKLYQETFKKIFTKETLKEASKGKYTDVYSRMLQLQNSEKYNKLCEEFAKKLTAVGLNKQKGIWKKYYEAAKEMRHIVLPSTYKEFQIQMMRKAVEKNFKMIKTIPSSIMKVYEQKNVDDLINEVALGNASRKAFEKHLKKQGAKNARVIARTEAAKLQTTIDEIGSTSLGSVCYEWLSSKDRRTRPSHRDMNGVIVFWRDDAQKPLLDNMRGNAGEFPNCRCSPLSIFDENDLTKSSYRVYNYKTDKIITLPKKKLLECIKKGGL